MNKKGRFDMTYTLLMIIIITTVLYFVSSYWVFPPTEEVLETQIGKIIDVDVNNGGFGSYDKYILTFEDGTKIITKDVITKNNVDINCEYIKYTNRVFGDEWVNWRCKVLLV